MIVLELGKYMYAVAQPNPGRKTGKWQIRAMRDDAVLGQVQWFGRWRQYAFFPSQAIFNAGCLGDVAAFINERMEEHRHRPA